MPKLFPYQVTGLAFLLQNKKAMLGDQPGLGKTAQALSAAAVVTREKLRLSNVNVCVIGPRTSLANWEREFDKWVLPKVRLRMDVQIVNYEKLIIDGPAQQKFLSTDWDIVIVDEAHRLKNVGAKRTQQIYRKIHTAKNVWLLTGTPARNHAGEMWTHIRALRPDLIQCQSGTMDLDQFENQYCRVGFDDRGNRKILGSKNMGELRTMLEKSGFFLRRLKKDVQSELPDLIFDDYALPMPTGADVDPRAKALFPDLTRASDDEVWDVIVGNTGINLSEAMHVLGVAKAPVVAAFVDEELEAPGKIIVFYKHKNVGDILANDLAHHDPARVDGKTKDPMAEVDKFQDPNHRCRVFLGQINSCQEALNLTQATQCVFAEASWSPSDNEQAASRGHRIGMQDSYVVRFANLAGTLDEVVTRVLRRKTEELYELFG